jgi:hypothetical protein
MCPLPTCKAVEVLEVENGNIIFIHYNADRIPIWMELAVQVKKVGEEDKIQYYRYLPMSISDLEAIPDEISS